MVNKILNNYQQLEYIQSSGTLYIDTSALHSAITVDYEAKQVDGSTSAQIFLATSASSNWVGWRNDKPATGGGNIDVDARNFRKYSCNYTSSTITLTDIATGLTSSTPNGTLTDTLHLFGWNGGQFSSNTASKNIQIKDSNGVLIRNFIPAKRKSDNVVGMIDLVNSDVNLWDEVWEQGGISGSDGRPSSNVTIRSVNFCPIQASTAYCKSIIGGSTFTRIFFYTASQSFISYIDSTSFTTPATAAYFKIQIGSGRDPISTYAKNFMLVKGSTAATSYSPYEGFYTNAGTGTFIAGPEVHQPSIYKTIVPAYPTDKIEGLSTQSTTPSPTAMVPITNVGEYHLNGLYNCGRVDLGTLNWTYRSDLATGVFLTLNVSQKASGRVNLYCSDYVTEDKVNPGALSDKAMVGYASNMNIYIRDTRYSDAATFKAAMSGKYVYFLRETDSAWNPPYLDLYLPEGGKNLFKITGLAGSSTVSYSGDTITILGTNVDSGKTLLDIFPNAQVGHTYYLSRDASSTAKSYIWLRTGGAGGQWSFGNAKTLTAEDFNGTVKFYGNSTNQTQVKMQIEEGSSATSYEPYVAPKGVLRKVGVTVCNGTETWTYDGGRYYIIPTGIASCGAVRTVDILATHFRPSTVNATGIIFHYNKELYVYPDMTLCPDVTALKAWLVSQYANGTPVTLIYPLATPVVESPKPIRNTSYKTLIPYYPNKDILGETTQTGTPTPSAMIPVVSKQPYELNELYNGGKVDMGTLTWTLRTDMGANIFAHSGLSKVSGVTNLYIDDDSYTLNSSGHTALADKQYCGYSTNYIIVKDTRFTDAATFKTAMSGKNLYYQRTGDTSWTAPYIDKYCVNGGKNLFDATTSRLAEAGTLQSDGSYYFESARMIGIWTPSNKVVFNGKENTQYGIRVQIKSDSPSSSVNIAFGVYYSDGSIGSIGTRGAYTDYNLSTGVTTADKTVIGFGVYYQTSESVYIKDLCVVEGSTAPTSYEPYVAPHGILRKVGVLTLDGVISGKKATGVSTVCLESRGYYGFYGILSSSAFTSFIGFKCSHFASSSADRWVAAQPNEISTQGAQVSPSIFLCVSSSMNITSVDEMNTWLAQQFQNGTPIKIYYPLATPVAENPKYTLININKSQISYIKEGE